MVPRADELTLILKSAQVLSCLPKTTTKGKNNRFWARVERTQIHNQEAGARELRTFWQCTHCVYAIWLHFRFNMNANRLSRDFSGRTTLGLLAM